jgi:hypothetical protein
MSGYLDERALGAFLDELWTVWEKKPHVFRQPFSPPVATPSDYWSVMVGWADEVRAGRRFAPPRWIEEGLLPTGEDAGIEAFCRRVEGRYEGDWYLYEPDGVQQWGPTVWDHVAEIVRPIVGHIGRLPPGGLNLDLFLGKYDRTPTGIHRDEGDVLAFVTHGTKHLYFWPYEAFTAPWGTPARNHYQTGIWDYTRHVGSAIAIEAHAGDVIYWPRQYYHIGASPNAWAGMVTMTMWWNMPAQRAVRYMADALWPVDDQPANYRYDPEELSLYAGSLPGDLAAASAAMQRRLGQGWDRSLAEAWARAVTSYGFLVPPAQRPVADGAVERFRVRHPVAVVEISGQDLVFACGHRAGALDPATPALRQALPRLAVGQVVDVRREWTQGQPATPATAQLLTNLQRAGAIEVV